MSAIPEHGLSPLHVSRDAPVRLSDMRHGQFAMVVEVAEPRLGARLAARGLIPGATLEVLRAGDPMLVRVEESRWALAGAEATLVTVERAGRAAGFFALLRGLAIR